MGLIDAFGKEDRVEVTFSAFYELMKGCTEREFLMREMVTGKSEDEGNDNDRVEDN